MYRKPLIIICGPTASGKSELAVRLAKEIGEIISADSMQVYKFMDIGTAKPEKKLLNSVKHYMIDVITPDRDFSAYEFITRAERIIKSLYKRKKIPFIVGGTGLYIQALIYGLSDAPGRDIELREKLKNIAKEKGLSFLYKRLGRVDPIYAEKVSPNDPVRIIRALEVYEKTGIPFSKFCKEHIKNPRYDALWIGINLERKKLYDRINRRTEMMFEKGFIDETKKLLEMGYSDVIIKKRGIGYEDVIDYIQGKITLASAIKNVQKKTRHYAKRQLTWFRKEKNIKWFQPEQVDKIQELINNWIAKIDFN